MTTSLTGSRSTALARFFDSYARLRPVNATFTGIHDHDHRLPDWSPDGRAAAVDEMQRVREELVAERHMLSDGALTDVGTRDRELAISFLDVQLAEHASRHFVDSNPSLAIGEAIFSVIALMIRPFADVHSRGTAATQRLQAFGAFLRGARETLADGAPGEWRTRCLRECDGAERLLQSGIRKWIDVESIGDPTATALADAAGDALGEVQAFREWVTRDLPAAPTDRLAAGAELFDLLLSRGHWSTRTRRELLAEASAALDEALARLDERARAVAPGGWPEVQQRLAASHPTAEAYLDTFHREWDACRARAEQAGLVTWPDYPIRYVPIPHHTRGAAPFLYYLFYRSPAPFDRLPMHDYVVPPIDGTLKAEEVAKRLRETNLSVIKLNHVVHHGAIGHHIQNFRAYEGTSDIGRIAAVDCASRIGMFLGGTMAEGWACYATDLMDEHGFFSPEESLAQQHTRARLLARAVVDIRLHERSMTFDEAIALYRDRVGMAAPAARAEACKNSMFPATAVMYWLGTDALHQLRRERERSEGSLFSLRAFHDRLLAFGSIPTPLIARVWS